MIEVRKEYTDLVNRMKEEGSFKFAVDIFGYEFGSIEEIVYEVADSYIPIYYEDIYAFAAEHPEAMNDYISEFGYPDNNVSFEEFVQCAAGLYFTCIVHDSLIDCLKFELFAGLLNRDIEVIEDPVVEDLFNAAIAYIEMDVIECLEGINNAVNGIYEAMKGDK